MTTFQLGVSGVASRSRFTTPTVSGVRRMDSAMGRMPRVFPVPVPATIPNPFPDAASSRTSAPCSRSSSVSRCSPRASSIVSQAARVGAITMMRPVGWGAWRYASGSGGRWWSREGCIPEGSSVSPTDRARQNPCCRSSSQTSPFPGRSKGRTRSTSPIANPKRFTRSPVPALNTGLRSPPANDGLVLRIPREAAVAEDEEVDGKRSIVSGADAQSAKQRKSKLEARYGDAASQELVEHGTAVWRIAAGGLHSEASKEPNV